MKKSAFLTFLTSLFFLIGCAPNRAVTLKWTAVSDWTKQEAGFKKVAESADVVPFCKENINGSISFPLVIEGAHRILLDNILVEQFGDHEFKRVKAFYGFPEVPCSFLNHGSTIKWEVYSFAKSFTHVNQLPVGSMTPAGSDFNSGMRIFGGGVLAIMALFAIVFFHGKVPNRMSSSIVISTLLLSVSMLTTSPGYLNIPGSMSTIQKISDGTLIVGTAFLFLVFHFMNFVRRWEIIALSLITLISFLIVELGSDPDMMQHGTSLSFPVWLLLLLVTTYRTFRSISFKSFKLVPSFPFIGSLAFTLAASNDILLTLDVYSGYFILPVGLIGAWFMIILSTNENINETYRERDHLQKHLEKEVERKTAELNEKNITLENTLIKLQNTQTDLIQAEKLASLGILAAAVAHEINNAIYGVSNALKVVNKNLDAMDASDKVTKTKKFTGVMNEGVELIINIVKSIRNYTGLNKQKVDELDVRTVVESVLTITRSRINVAIDLVIDIEDGLKIRANTVGFHQIFMNLFINAIDAMPSGGKLIISGRSISDQLAEITVKDSGVGIPKESQAKIFEMFYTTKEVGKGTGLGLHIVKTEVEKHGGTISVQSEVGIGTEFRIFIPKDGNNLKEKVDS